VTRAGFVAILGRPNVGKSTLLNRVVGTKVSITAKTPHTTRQAIRGIVTDDDVQVIFVDTPGMHRPRTSLGGRLNEAARAAADDVDVALAVLDAGAEIGQGDENTLRIALGAGRRGATVCVVLNKSDRVGKDAVLAQLIAAQRRVEEVAEDPARAAAVEYFAVSARTGAGVEELLAFVRTKMPESPLLFPDDEVSDVEEGTWVAELVREQLVRKTSQELPHSIHCRVSEFDWPHVTVEILVERESQKGMVIGKGGQLLKEVGIAAREQLPEGTYLELRVRVEPSWQKHDDILDRLGY
jgi:GTPase